MNLLNVSQTVFFLAFGLTLFHVPFSAIVCVIAALVVGIVMLINLIKTA